MAWSNVLKGQAQLGCSDYERDWDLDLPKLLLAYLTSMHETAGTTPFFLMFGRNSRLPEDVIYSLPAESYKSAHHYCRELNTELQQVYGRVSEYYIRNDSIRKMCKIAVSYHVNDMVFLHCPAVPSGLSHKFHKPWQGPYRVVKRLLNSVYGIAQLRL